MNDQQGYPTTMYASPEEWGNVTDYADSEGMERTIDSLKESGGPEWEDIKLSDCAVYHLITVCKDDTAAYRQSRTRENKEVTIFERASVEHYYDLVEVYNTDYDDEELAALGVPVDAIN